MARGVTKQELDELIKRRKREGKSLSIEYVVAEEDRRWGYHEASKKYYGGWSKALVANGAQPNLTNALTKEQVIDIIRNLASEGHPLTTTTVDNRVVSSATKHFGKWSIALKEIGVASFQQKKPSRVRDRWTDDVILENVTKYIEKGYTASDIQRR